MMEGRQRRPSSVRRRAERSKVIRSNQYVAMYVQIQLKDIGKSNTIFIGVWRIRTQCSNFQPRPS